MEIISNSSQVDIKKAAQALMDGHLVAFPTETVYGLGANASDEKAVQRIYSVKGRPADHPLIVHVADINQIQNWAIGIPDYAFKLGINLWPGPLTLILKRSKLAKDFITGSQNSVGLRIPGHPVALELIRNFQSLGGLGVVAPSANRFGAVSPTSAEDVSEELGIYLSSEDVIINDGISELGIESTIIDCTGPYPSILRPGFITAPLIENSTGLKIFSHLNHSLKVSGNLDSHYSPRAEVIVSSDVLAGEGFIAMIDFPTPLGALRLASPKTVEQYAKVLYKAFRSADHMGISKVKIIPPTGSGLAESINDRISKASRGTQKIVGNSDKAKN